MFRMAKRILVVEDTANIRQIVGYALKQQGYEVLEAADGDEGLRKARAEKPDLLILDAMLPGMTGFEVCNELKADEATRGLPILILTAITQGTGKSDEFWQKKSRADAFMSKPFKSKDLVDAVQKLIGTAKPEGAEG